MGIFDNFSGGASRRDINRGYQQGQGRFAQAGQTYGDQYNRAQGRYDQYAQSGQQANSLYGNYLGLNGGDAQRDAFSGYQESPYANFDRDRITQASMRANNARGTGGSGVEALATSRALREYGTQGLNTYLDRLQGQQGMGLQVANAQAGNDMRYGDQMGQLAGQRAGLDTQRASALAGTRSMGLQNAMGIAGLGLSAFMPGAAGLSAAGSLGGMLSGAAGGFGQGMNSLFGAGAPNPYMGGSGPGFGSFRGAQGY
jgi:hypothetical protein